MAQASVAAQQTYNIHKTACQALNIPQSTLEHRSLMGSLGTASATGNQIYTGPGPQTADLVTTKVRVWMVHTPLTRASESTQGNMTEFGHQGMNMTRGQFPAIDDFGNSVNCTQDDLVVDASGVEYRISNPVLDAGISFWSCMLSIQR